jgi:hypothetical protein
MSRQRIGCPNLANKTWSLYKTISRRIERIKRIVTKGIANNLGNEIPPWCRALEDLGRI